MTLSILWVAALAFLLAGGFVASYLRLLIRRLTPREAQRVFRSGDRGKIRADRERVGVSISALHGAAMALFSVGLAGFFIWHQPEDFWQDLGAALLVAFGAVMILDQLIPFILVARHDEPERILAEWLPILQLVVYLALPLTFPVLISGTIARLLESPEEPERPPKPQEGLEELIQAGEEEGLIEESEGELLQSVVEFKGKIVREVMTPRPEIAALEINSPIEELRDLFRERRYTRYVVYTGELDQIEGIVSVRDLMELPPEEQARVTLRSLVRPAFFVPETKLATDLLKELQQMTVQLAIVVDEYGSVAGLVTIEDLVEELVGEIRDEVEPHDRDLVKESATTYLVAGHAELARISEELNVTFEPGDYSTVAGLVLSRLGHLPARGEKFQMGKLAFEVVEVSERAVLKVRLIFGVPVMATDPAHADRQSV
jgi:putative hemolysin